MIGAYGLEAAGQDQSWAARGVERATGSAMGVQAACACQIARLKLGELRLGGVITKSLLDPPGHARPCRTTATRLGKRLLRLARYPFSNSGFQGCRPPAPAPASAPASPAVPWLASGCSRSVQVAVGVASPMHFVGRDSGPEGPGWSDEVRFRPLRLATLRGHALPGRAGGSLAPVPPSVPERYPFRLGPLPWLIGHFVFMDGWAIWLVSRAEMGEGEALCTSDGR